jgi:hypothetical protein
MFSQHYGYKLLGTQVSRRRKLDLHATSDR